MATIVGGVIAMLGGLVVIWLAVRMWLERLPRNPVAGVRTRSAMRSDDAFRVVNKAAAPLIGASGVILIAGGLAAALLPKSTAAIALFVGAVACGGLCIAGAAKGSRAAR